MHLEPRLNERFMRMSVDFVRDLEHFVSHLWQNSQCDIVPVQSRLLVGTVEG